MFGLILASDILSCLVIGFVFYIILRPMVSGAIYYPTTAESVEIMIKLAGAKPGEKMTDIGSGDGRILIAFAKNGVEAHGYEVNPFLVWRSRHAIHAAGLKGKAIVHWKSFWDIKLTQYQTVVVYMFPHTIKRLEKKLVRELSPGTNVISNVFDFPHWRETLSEDKVRLYRIGQII